jgi:hypothetical protein
MQLREKLRLRKVRKALSSPSRKIDIGQGSRRSDKPAASLLSCSAELALFQARLFAYTQHAAPI